MTGILLERSEAVEAMYTGENLHHIGGFITDTNETEQWIGLNDLADIQNSFW